MLLCNQAKCSRYGFMKTYDTERQSNAEFLKWFYQQGFCLGT